MPIPNSLLKISQSENSVIYQTNNFTDGLYFLSQRRIKNKNKWALFDLDNTILSYRHTLGTDQWFDFDFNAFISQGLQPHEAKAKTLQTALEIVDRTHEEDVYVVEEHTPAAIRRLQSDNIPTLILTSRGKYLREKTLSQLSRFELDFNKGLFKNREFALPATPESEFYHGMVLTDGQHKGEALIYCLENMTQSPEYIVMWDDKKSNLDKVSSALASFNEKQKRKNKDFVPIQFIGIRYSRLDQFINNVKPDVIELQKRYFKRILSDEHALAILKSEQKKNANRYIDIDYQADHRCVVLSLYKADQYKIMLNLEPTMDQHRMTTNGIKLFNGKEKLVWQFKFTEQEFRSLFQKMSQHGLIEPGQFNVLSTIFNPQRPAITNLYHLRPRNNVRPVECHSKLTRRVGVI